MKIYVSGSVAFDRIMDFPGRFSDHILPDKIHILNVCFTINSLRENFGGTAGNIAFTLSQFGEKPYIIATAGRDFETYREWLNRNSLPDAHIDVVPEELTAGAYITTDRSDNQITAFNPGAMAHRSTFDVGSVDAETALAIVAPGNLDDMYTFACNYRSRQVPYIFDPGQSLPAWSADRLLEVIEGSEILISNDYELQMIMDKTKLSQAALLEMTGWIITTLGEEGSDVKCLENGSVRIVHTPPAAVRRVCDPTGAGDAYRAGLIKGMRLPGKDVFHGARMGSVSAAYAVEVYGTQTFCFTAEEFNSRFMDTFGTKAF